MNPGIRALSFLFVNLALVAGSGSSLAAPANDNFADRTSLPSLQYVRVTGSNVSATKEPNEPNHAGNNPGGKSVWWSWTAPISGQVRISTAGSTKANGFALDTLLAVYQGNPLVDNPVQRPVVGNDDFGDATSRVEFGVVAGEAYEIAVDGFSSDGVVDAGSIVLTVLMLPANDYFADRLVLPSQSNVSTTGSNVGASRETDEPFHSEDQINTGGQSVWWTWQAPATGVLTVSTAGSDFDTLLAIYTGNLVTDLTPVGLNDNVSPTDFTSQVAFLVAPDGVYHFAVDGFRNGDGNVAEGNILLNLSFTPGHNDDFVNAHELAGLSAVASGTNIGATREPGEPDHAGLFGDGSVWWYWTAPASGPVSISTAGSDFDTVLAVYSGSDLATLSSTLVAADDDSGPGETSLVNFFAQAGVTYRMAVEGLNGQRGQIQLALLLSVPVLHEVVRLADGRVQLEVELPDGSEFGVLASTDLVNWVRIATQPITGTSETFVDADAVNHPMRFYRIVQP